MNDLRLEQAISAYLKFLQGKNVKSDAVDLRARFLKKFSIFLKDKTRREEYGNALETVLKVESNIDEHQQLNIAREFYPFWMNDLKMIAKMSESYGFDLSISQLKPLPTLTVDDLNNQKLDDLEADLINHYATELKVNNLNDDVVEAKVRLVKLVLLRLRDIPVKNNVSYRMAVEGTLPLFNLEDIKQRFLQSVREFFYIWIVKVDPMYEPIYSRG